MKRLILAVVLCLSGVANAGFIPGQVLTAAQLNAALGAVTGLATTTNPVVVSGASAPSTGQVLTATSPTTAAWQVPITIPAYLGTACNNTLYPASLLCVSNAPTADVENHNIGVLGGGLATYAASGTPLTGWGVGLYGKGWTNGYTRSAGTVGEGMVTATGDVGSAVGLRGYAKQTHAGGANIGVLGDATGGLTNFDLYSVNGTITSATGTLTNTGDLTTTGKLTVGSGTGGFLFEPFPANTVYSAIFPGGVTPGITNYAMVASSGETRLNAVSTSGLYVSNSPIVAATLTGAAVTGTLSSTGVTTASAGLVVGAGSYAQGKLYTTAANGLFLIGSTGSSTDFALTNAGGSQIFNVPTGTQTLNIAAGGSLAGNTIRHIIATAPTIASGFGTSPTITALSTAALKITVGTGGAASGVLTFPAATTGWAVHCTDVTSRASIIAVAVSTSTTSVTVEAYSRTTGLATTFAAGDVLEFSALGY